MGHVTTLGYRCVVRLGTALVPALGWVNAKARAGHDGRRLSVRRLQDWALEHRDLSRPLVWFHASSVGEGLQADSVLNRLRLLRPDCQVVYTHFSPSAEGLARRVNADISDYLPYDTPGAVRTLLEALRPDLLVFAKLDLWPELATQAAARGTAVALVAATVSPGSGRLRWPARSLLAAGYEAVTHAAAISSDDGARLARLGVRSDRITVLGDPRYDSVETRVRAVPAEETLLRLGGAGTLVAGSTWPQDETVLLEAFGRLLQQGLGARLILVPHEPTAAHLENIEREAARLHLPSPVRLSRAAGPAPLLVVDKIGVLATLYGAGVAAYVGGGFGSAGLHSVLEPAAWGIPVAFGPRWTNSRDAELLLQAGGAESVESGNAGAQLATLWERWIINDDARQAQGRRARSVVEQGLGAADRTATSLLPLLRTSPNAGR